MSKRALQWFSMQADRLSPAAHVVFHRLCLTHEEERARMQFAASSFARDRRAPLDRKTVYAALDELESLGLIRRERSTVWLAVPLNLEMLEGPKNGLSGGSAKIGDMLPGQSPKNGLRMSEKRTLKVQKTDTDLIQTEEQVMGPAPSPVDNLALRLARCAVSAEAGLPWLNPITGHFEQAADFARISAELLAEAEEQ